MSQPLQLFIDVQNRQLVRGIDTSVPYTLPNVYQGDTLSLSLRFLQATGDQSTPYEDIDYSLASVVVAVGSIGLSATAGFFTLTDTAASQSTGNIAFNATASAVQGAIQAALTTNWSTATVTGNAGGPYTITEGANGALANLIGTSVSLTPLCSVVVSNIQTGTANLPSIQYVQIEQNPIALQDTWTPLPAPTADVARLQAGSSIQNEIQQITLGNSPYSGAFVVNFGSATSAPIQWNASALSVQTALQAMSCIGAGNCSVGGGVGAWIVTFTGTLALASQSLMTTVATGLVGPLALTGNLALNTSGIEEAIGELSSITQLLAVQVTPAGGSAFTVIQDPITIQNDLIVGAPSAPTSSVSYYTTAASDARFFQVADNLSEATASTVRTNLGLVVGTDVQAQSATLDTLASSNPFFTGTNIGFSGVWPHLTISTSAASGSVIGIRNGTGSGANDTAATPTQMASALSGATGLLDFSAATLRMPHTGSFMLSSGTQTIADTGITSGCVILPTVQIVSGTRRGNPDIVPTPGTGFTAIGYVDDNSTYNYVVIN